MMQKDVQIFNYVALRVTSAAIFSKILQDQQNSYNIQYCKIQNPQGQAMLKLYTNIKNRLSYVNQQLLVRDSWNQNERKVFIWFIISYTHFLKIDKESIPAYLYEQLSSVFFGKNPKFLHFQHLSLLKSKNRITWTSQQDELLTKCISQLTPGKWSEISKKLFYDSHCQTFRTSKHCRQRWLNHLDTNKKHGQWSPQEDLVILQFVTAQGKKWSKIMPLLNQTRTQHMIKNRYNSLIQKSKRRKLKEDQIVRILLSRLYSADKVANSRKRERQSNGIDAMAGPNGQNFTTSINQVANGFSYGPEIPNCFIPTHGNPMQMASFLNQAYFFYSPLIFNQNQLSCHQVQDNFNLMLSIQNNSRFQIYQAEVKIQQSL